MAILSFTLNRVYTEWYRNKGYSFTIIVRGSILHVDVADGRATFKISEGDSVTVEIFGKKYEITKEGVSVEY